MELKFKDKHPVLVKEFSLGKLKRHSNNYTNEKHHKNQNKKQVKNFGKMCGAKRAATVFPIRNRNRNRNQKEKLQHCLLYSPASVWTELRPAALSPE
jgi:hypothetical protein